MADSERFKRALRALHSDEITYASAAVDGMQSKSGDEQYDYVYALLSLMKDEAVDAMCVLMYEGRDEYIEGCPYASDRIDEEFAREWDHLGMDRENHAREIMAEKVPLLKYLERGDYMYGFIDYIP